MILKTDLRIGNLVTDKYYESFRTTIEVDSIHGKGINISASDDGRPYGMASPILDFEYEFDSLEGIPLVEEWFLKFGFEKDGNMMSISGAIYGVSVIKESSDWQLRIGCDGLWNPIKYVHQLQNLVYTLIGEELTIKTQTT